MTLHYLMSGYVMKRQTSVKVAEHLGIQPQGDTTTLAALVAINRYIRKNHNSLRLPELDSVLHPQFKPDDCPHMLGVMVNYGERDGKFEEDPKYKPVKQIYMSLGDLVEEDFWWDTVCVPRKTFVNLLFTQILDLPLRVCLRAGYIMDRKMIPRIATTLGIEEPDETNLRSSVGQRLRRHMKAQEIPIGLIFPNRSTWMVSNSRELRIAEPGTKFPPTDHDERMKAALMGFTGLGEADLLWDTVVVPFDS
ncbi:hypothetical protein ONZ45_g15776 [Pleurotus djamor]|nr:hypothetical protein ONZ45_g15776 [Pleurotus djamor]